MGNVIAANLISPVDEEGYHQMLLAEIEEHRVLHDVIPISKGVYNTNRISKGTYNTSRRTKRKKHTENDEKSSYGEKMVQRIGSLRKLSKESYIVQLVKYAVTNDM